MKFKTIFLAGLMAVSAGAAYATDWANIQGGPDHAGYADIKTDPANIHLLWSKKVDWDIKPFFYRFFSAAEGKIFFAPIDDQSVPDKPGHYHSVGGLVAMDAKTGATVWQQMVTPNGEITTPVYDNGRVYVVVERDKSLYLDAYDANTGALDYAVPVNGWRDDGVVVANGSAYLYTQSEQISRFNDKSGKALWSVPVTNQYEHEPVAAVGDKYLVQSVFNRLVVQDVKTGKQLFEIHPDNAGYDERFIRTPVLDEKHDMAFHHYAVTVDKGNYSYWQPTLIAFDLTTQKVKWMFADSFDQAVVAGDEVYTSNYAQVPGKDKSEVVVSALDRETGKVNWVWYQNDSDRRAFERFNMAATKDLLFVPCVGKTIAISRKTHKKVWEIDKLGYLAIVGNELIIAGYENDDYVVTAVAL